MIVVRYVQMLLLLCLGCMCQAAAHNWPLSGSKSAVESLTNIPQTHCLRLFKHDVHLMRRCRNHRFPKNRKPLFRK